MLLFLPCVLHLCPHQRFPLTARYNDAHGPATRQVKHAMLLPHEIFATLHAANHSELLYENLQQATWSHILWSRRIVGL